MPRRGVSSDDLYEAANRVGFGPDDVEDPKKVDGTRNNVETRGGTLISLSFGVLPPDARSDRKWASICT